MRLPYLPSLLLVVTILTVTLAEPDVFGDYFDDGMKLVDISQDAALRSCLSDGKTADKTKAAYDGCYGKGYDFDDLAKAGSDDNGLPAELEEKEGCFYKKMGWVSEDNVMDEAAIAADMEGLESQIQDGFLSDVGTCVAWSGNFGKRRKREAGMEVQGEPQDTQDRELVPGLMDTGRRAMGWVRKLVRKVRSPGKRQQRQKNNCPDGKKGNKCRRENRKRNKRGKKKKGNNNKNQVGGRKKRKMRNGKKTKSKNGGGNRQTENSKKRRARKGGKGNGKGGRGDGRKMKQSRKRNGNGQGGRKTKKRKGKDKNINNNKKPKKDSERKSRKKKNNKQDNNENDERKDQGKRKNDKSLPEAVYNKLWCIDLAIEQALEKCVEAKILN